MPHPFPHVYEVKLQRDKPGLATITDANAAPIQAGPPVQFDGEPGYFSPETLLMSSVSLCFMTTLESLARRQNLTIKDYRSEILGTLEKTKDGLVFTSIKLIVKIDADPSQADAINGLIPTAKKYCIISNALKIPVEVALQVAQS